MNASRFTFYTLLFVALLCLSMELPGLVRAQSGGGYDLTWSSVDGGGMFSAGGGYALGGTVGQPDAGAALAGGGYTLTGGFWQAWSAAPIASLVVNTLADADTDDAYCSLREAIVSANTDAAYHGCAAGSGDDMITFSVTGAITLASALPEITSNININGPGVAELAVSGDGQYRVFDVTSAVTSTLQNLTVRDGYCPSTPGCGGAGIRTAGGALTIVNTRFLSNTVAGGFLGSFGGAIMVNGTAITISHSLLSGNYGGSYGGAIYAEDAVLNMDNSTLDGNVAGKDGGALELRSGVRGTIVSSTFTHNSAQMGGAIALRYGGVATVTHSTFYSNTGSYPDAGSGIKNNGNTLTVVDTAFSSNEGTALSQAEEVAALTVSNSAFFDNHAGAGYGASALGCGGGKCGVVNSTFANNTGGPAISGYPDITFTLLNSTIAGNTAGGLYRVPGVVSNTVVANNNGSGNCAESTLTNGGNNLDSGATCGFGAANGSQSNTDPLLGPLADNGGPTLTMAPSYQSPVIDGVTYNAPNGCPATDQRGVARPIDGDGDGDALCDIGAYESSQLLSQTITFNPLANKVVGDPPFIIAATASSGLPVSFSASGVCSVNANTVTLSGISGACTITATQAGDATYAPAPSVDQSFTVLLTQTITFAPLADKRPNDPPFAITATASSGLPVSFSAGGVCSVNANTVTLSGISGACTITATQAGDATYAPAPGLARTFQVKYAIYLPILVRDYHAQ